MSKKCSARRAPGHYYCQERMKRGGLKRGTLICFAALAMASPEGREAAAQPMAGSRALEVRFTPTARAQIALWIEKPDGTFVGTLRLTQAVALHGIGNRPGASQMNSGYRWPYGRRVDVLPVWGHRRAAGAGAAQFKQVIFQNRMSEGCASNAACGVSDSSIDPYFCLTFMATDSRKDNLDAISCATVFSSDKGRYLTSADVAAGYAEPIEANGLGSMRPLELNALYPPRRDGFGCGLAPGCIDHPDAVTYADHVRAVMPDIDTVTMATPAGDQEQTLLFTVPPEWTDSDYVAWIEVNVEGDHNAAYDMVKYDTPRLPEGAWDSWAIRYGYPYRGQPSVVYRVPFSLASAATYSAAVPVGYGSVDGFGPTGGDLRPMDATITDAPSVAVTAGSGADRLRFIAPADYRIKVGVRDLSACAAHTGPAMPGDFTVTNDTAHSMRHAHEWGYLRFKVPASDRPIDRYEVRYSAADKAPIIAGQQQTFDRALPALAAKMDSEALMIRTSDAAGTMVEVPFGGMVPLTRYSVAIRAVDTCNVPGPFAVAELKTTEVHFTKLSGCFIATAAFGSAMEPEVEALRQVRDQLRPRSPLFAAVTDLYYRSGPAAAAIIARSDTARAAVRSALRPVVELASAVGPGLDR
jgi:hypothetical protein